MSSPISNSWLLLRTGAQPAAENMATDEALLEGAATSGGPVVRFYAWSEPAATFGYFQKFSEVERMTALRPLIRRPTGGGLVPHDADWTYSLVFPPGHAWYELRAVESYQRAHAWIQAAFGELNVTTELAPCCRPEAPGQCFAGAERFDVLWQDRKIAGGAQRRNRLGLLIQGSIQPPAGVGRGAWEESFCEVARREWGVVWKPFETGAVLRERVQGLTAEKYSRQEYNERR